MYARVFRLEVSPDDADRFAQPLQESAATLKDLAGFRAGYLLLDRQGGDSMTVTLWESEEELQASMPAAREILSRVLQPTGLTPSEPRTFEVAVEL